MAYTVNKPIPKSGRRRTPIVLAIVTLLVLGVAGYVVHKHRSDVAAKVTPSVSQKQNAIDYSPAKPSDSTDNENRKSSPTAPSTLNGSSNPPSTVANFSAQIVNANNNSGNVHIGTSVSGITNGSCSLIGTQGTQSVNLGGASVQQNVNSYDCGVFNVPTSTFPASGTWKLTLTVTNGSVATSNSTTVKI